MSRHRGYRVRLASGPAGRVTTIEPPSGDSESSWLSAISMTRCSTSVIAGTASTGSAVRSTGDRSRHPTGLRPRTRSRRPRPPGPRSPKAHQGRPRPFPGRPRSYRSSHGGSQGHAPTTSRAADPQLRTAASLPGPATDGACSQSSCRRGGAATRRASRTKPGSSARRWASPKPGLRPRARTQEEEPARKQRSRWSKATCPHPKADVVILRAATIRSRAGRPGGAHRHGCDDQTNPFIHGGSCLHLEGRWTSARELVGSGRLRRTAAALAALGRVEPLANPARRGKGDRMLTLRLSLAATVDPGAARKPSWYGPGPRRSGR